MSLTVHVPTIVRDQLKRLALDRGTTLHAICGEAFNMLFAREGQPENRASEAKAWECHDVVMDTW